MAGAETVTGADRDSLFTAAWEGAVEPRLAEIESHRCQIRNRILLGWLATVAVCVPAMWLVTRYELGGNDGPAFVFAALVVGMGSAWSYYYFRFRDRFKNELVASLVTAFDQRLQYIPHDSVSMEEFVQSGLVREFPVTGFEGEDLLRGKIGATAIRFSEVRATYQSGTSNRARVRKLFRGVFFVADFNKDFTGRTYVLPDKAQRLLGGAGQALQGMRSAYGELVKLEDLEFERHFVVYSDSQIEARYLLSAALMARITDFRNRHGHPLRLGFVDSNLYVAISVRRNLFEPRVFRTLSDPALYREFWDDLALFTGVVEELNLNTRIWTKR